MSKAWTPGEVGVQRALSGAVNSGDMLRGQRLLAVWPS
jgi:hypothetical protein